MKTFRSLHSVDEYARTQADFVAVFARSATHVAEQRVGVPGGNWLLPVRFLQEHDIWFAHQRFRSRNWNVFGVGDPFGSRAVTPSVQLNLAHGPGMRRLSATFMLDEDGRRWVGHNGRLGGGKLGVNIDAFLAFYPRQETVRIDRGRSVLIVLGCIEAPDGLVAAVAELAGAAKSFREQLNDDQPPNEPPQKSPSLAAPGEDHLGEDHLAEDHLGEDHLGEDHPGEDDPGEDDLREDDLGEDDLGKHDAG